MGRYLIRRLFMMIPLVTLISFIAFSLIHLAPTDPAEAALRANVIVPTAEAVAEMREQLGLNAPFLTRYVYWLADCLRLDFGYSYVTGEPVSTLFARHLPATLWLSGIALVLTIIVSIPLGVVLALKEGSWLDKAVRGVLFFLTSMPNYWLGLLLVWWLSVKLDLLPIGGMDEPGAIILPSVTLALGYIGTYFRLIRNNMLNNMHLNHVFFARARGLSERNVINKHILVNSLQSSLVALGMSIPKLIAGTVVIENIFAWPGIGRLCVSAIFDRDYPVIQSYVLLMAILFVLCNLLTDLLQVRLDPRLRLGES